MLGSRTLPCESFLQFCVARKQGICFGSKGRKRLTPYSISCDQQQGRTMTATQPFTAEEEASAVPATVAFLVV